MDKVTMKIYKVINILEMIVMKMIRKETNLKVIKKMVCPINFKTKIMVIKIQILKIFYKEIKNLILYQMIIIEKMGIKKKMVLTIIFKMVTILCKIKIITIKIHLQIKIIKVILINVNHFKIKMIKIKLLIQILIKIKTVIMVVLMIKLKMILH